MTPAETVTAFIGAIQARDIDTAIRLVSDDCEYDNVPMGKVVGPQAIAELLGPMITACQEVEWVVLRQAAEGNVVFNERVDRFRMPHGWVEVPVAGVWEVVGGRIQLWRDYFDLPTFREQMAE